MAESIQIPMFPLTMLPLPGELVPLHIFEPRYKQLLEEAERIDLSFGIYFSHESNAERIGSLMKLESIVKRYPGGESDIVVKCIDLFSLDVLYRTFKEKLYPGGDVRLWQIDPSVVPGAELCESFIHFMNHRNISRQVTTFTVFQIANELSMDFAERYAFLLSSDLKRERILLNRIKFLIHVLNQEEKSKDVFHLN